MTVSTKTDSLDRVYAERFPKSAALMHRAGAIFPSGVTHDGRFLKPFAPFIESAHGAVKRTVDGIELIDYWMGHGSLLLGHGDPAIVAAVRLQLERGTHFGACHEREIEWAERVAELVPIAERVRFTSSGTEATLMAIRVARLVTGRTKIIKLAGHFHGWHDQLAPAADPPHTEAAYRVPGVPDEVISQLVVVPPNDIERLRQAIETHRPAAVILEGTGGRWGCVPLEAEYVQTVRELTKATSTLFILDEVITGFRVAPGGAQQVFHVEADMATYAKVLAGGLPGGCLVGKSQFMEAIAFDNSYGRKMKHPGTYNGNPLSAAAGIAMLEQVATGAPNAAANDAGRALRSGLNRLFWEHDVPWVAYGHFSLTHIIPDADRPQVCGDDYRPFDGDFGRIDQPLEPDFVHRLRCAALLGGVDLMGHGLITSSVHTSEVIEQTIDGFEIAIDHLRSAGLV